MQNATKNTTNNLNCSLLAGRINIGTRSSNFGARDSELELRSSGFGNPKLSRSAGLASHEEAGLSVLVLDLPHGVPSHFLAHQHSKQL